MNKTIRYKNYGGKATLIDCCPGNGTRYLLVLSELSSTGDDLCNKRIITWVNARKAMEIPDHWSGHYGLTLGQPVMFAIHVKSRATYIAGKMECNMEDATAIAECLETVL